jgi:hypothetical protein
MYRNMLCSAASPLVSRVKMLYHVLYASSAPRPLDDLALGRLLEVARRNNARVAVTGMLLYADGNFIQYLEGAEEAVRGVFERVRDDPRHHGVLTISEGPVEQRVFADWSMGFHKLATNERAFSGKFDLSLDALNGRINAEAPELLKVMMRRFYEATHRYVAD